jgi:hypothetical protein
VTLQSLNAFDEEDDQSSIEGEKRSQAKRVQFIHQTAREYLRTGNLPPNIVFNLTSETSHITFKRLVMGTTSAGYVLPGQLFLVQAITYYQELVQKDLPRILGDHFFQYALDLDEMIDCNKQNHLILSNFMYELTDFMRSSSFNRRFRDVFRQYGLPVDRVFKDWMNRVTPAAQLFVGIAVNLHNVEYRIPNDFTAEYGDFWVSFLDFTVFGPRLTERRLDRVRTVKMLLKMGCPIGETSSLTRKLPKTGVEAMYEEGFKTFEEFRINTLQALIICSDNVSGISERTRLEIAELLLENGAKVDFKLLHGTESRINFKGWEFAADEISKFCLSFRSLEWVALILRYGHALPIDTSVHKLLLEKDTLITCSQYRKLWERLEELGESCV